MPCAAPHWLAVSTLLALPSVARCAQPDMEDFGCDKLIRAVDYLDGIKQRVGIDCWTPGTEFVVRSGHNTDSVAQVWWTQGVTQPIANTPDPEIK